MSEWIAAEIWIGGKIPAALVPELCRLIGEETALECGEAAFEPTAARELMKARRNEHGTLLLHLVDDQARWGQFEALEQFLEQHGVPFRRRTEGKYQYDPELIEFRPGLGPLQFMTDHSGRPVVPAAGLQAIDAAVKQALAGAQHSSTRSLALKLRGIQRRVRAHLPRTVPPLESFEIVQEVAAPERAGRRGNANSASSITRTRKAKEK